MSDTAIVLIVVLLVLVGLALTVKIVKQYENSTRRVFCSGWGGCEGR